MVNQKQLINVVMAKKGFVRIISDELTPDAVIDDVLEKRLIQVEHVNSDNTAGITPVYYVLDKATKEAKFYNVEPESFDTQEPSVNQKKIDRIKKYLVDTFDFVEVIAIDEEQDRVKAVVNKFSEDGKTSVESTVVSYKDKATKEFTHAVIE